MEGLLLVIKWQTLVRCWEEKMSISDLEVYMYWAWAQWRPPRKAQLLIGKNYSKLRPRWVALLGKVNLSEGQKQLDRAKSITRGIKTWHELLPGLVDKMQGIQLNLEFTWRINFIIYVWYFLTSSHLIYSSPKVLLDMVESIIYEHNIVNKGFWKTPLQLHCAVLSH